MFLKKRENLNSDLIDVKFSHDVGCLVEQRVFFISRYGIQSKVPKFYFSTLKKNSRSLEPKHCIMFPKKRDIKAKIRKGGDNNLSTPKHNFQKPGRSSRHYKMSLVLFN